MVGLFPWWDRRRWDIGNPGADFYPNKPSCYTTISSSVWVLGVLCLWSHGRAWFPWMIFRKAAKRREKIWMGIMVRSCTQPSWPGSSMRPLSLSHLYWCLLLPFICSPSPFLLPLQTQIKDQLRGGGEQLQPKPQLPLVGHCAVRAGLTFLQPIPRSLPQLQLREAKWPHFVLSATAVTSPSLFGCHEIEVWWAPANRMWKVCTRLLMLWVLLTPGSLPCSQLQHTQPSTHKGRTFLTVVPRWSVSSKATQLRAPLVPHLHHGLLRSQEQLSPSNTNPGVLFKTCSPDAYSAHILASPTAPSLGLCTYYFFGFYSCRPKSQVCPAAPSPFSVVPPTQHAK